MRQANNALLTPEAEEIGAEEETKIRAAAEVEAKAAAERAAQEVMERAEGQHLKFTSLVKET